MYAKNLESLLCDLMTKSDLGHRDVSEMDKRFAALRGSGKLPRSREKRMQALSVTEIVNCILGLATDSAGFAAIASIVLSKLLPVGGPQKSIGGTSNLNAALVLVLTDQVARASLISLSLSTREIAVNANGIAEILYEERGQTLRSIYVTSFSSATKDMSEDAVDKFETQSVEVSKEWKFDKKFFERVAGEIERFSRWNIEPAGDGSEYDAEDAENLRRVRLGVTSSSRYLSVGVDNQVDWPPVETLVEFDQFKLILMPKTSSDVQSIHIDMNANGLDEVGALTVVNRFLSVLTWCDDQFAIMQDGWSGNVVPVGVPKRNLAFTTTHDWVFSWNIPDTEPKKRALAIYREARNAEQNFMVSYAVLNYFKVIEVGNPAKEALKRWFKENFSVVERLQDNKASFEQFRMLAGANRIEDFLYKTCRLAVAHAASGFISDPDSSEEIKRLHAAADILRPLARYFIRVDLGLLEDRYS